MPTAPELKEGGRLNSHSVPSDPPDGDPASAVETPAAAPPDEEPARLKAREIVQRSLGAHAPPGLLRLEQRLRTGDASARELARLVEGTPPLAARVLRLANSVMYSPIEPVMNLPRAVAMIGNTILRQLVLTFLIMIRGSGRRSQQQERAAERLMTESIRAAAVARHLAALSGLSHPDDAFAAALIHELGHVYLLDTVGDPYAAYLLGADTDIGREIQLSGTTHLEVGVALAHDWQLPRAIQVVLSEHHRQSVDPLIRLIAHADRIAPELAVPAASPDSLSPAAAAALAELRIDRRRWSTLVPAIRREAKELLAVFEVA